MFSEADVADMESLYRKGWSHARIAQKYGCLPGSVWKRLKDRGVPMRSASIKPRSVSIHSHGYIKWGNSYVHRIVAAAWRDADLLPGEVVHHKNGDVTDCRPENLEVFESNTQHLKTAHGDRVWDREKTEALIALRQSSQLTNGQIAARLGVTKAAVDNHCGWLIKQGVIAPRPRWAIKAHKGNA